MSNIGERERGAIVRQLKLDAQRILKRAGIYQRTKTSWAYDLYWSFADPSIVARIHKEIQFYRNLLTGFQRGGLIF